MAYNGGTKINLDDAEDSSCTNNDLDLRDIDKENIIDNILYDILIDEGWKNGFQREMMAFFLRSNPTVFNEWKKITGN